MGAAMLRGLGFVLRPFRLELAPAAQAHSYQTAIRDVAKIVHHWTVVVLVLVVSEAVSITTAVATHLTVAEKLLLGIFGGAAGALIVVGPLGFVGLLIAAPYRQRNYARAQLRNLAAPEFPPHDISIESPWYGDLPERSDPNNEIRVLFLPVRYTNRQADRGVSLDFDLFWRERPGPIGSSLGPRSVSHGWRAVAIKPQLDLPLHIAPDRTEIGNLAFEPHESWVWDYGEVSEVWVKERYEIAVRVTDHVSGGTIEVPVPERERKDSGRHDEG